MKEKTMNILCYLLITFVIVAGVIILNARFEQIESCENKGNSRNYCIETFER